MKSVIRGLFVARSFCRCISSEATAPNAQGTTRQNELFNREKERQLSLVKRIEKISVEHVDGNETCKLIMNKYLSTPYNVAMHLNQRYMDQAAVAMVNDKPWHMLQPLIEDCELRFVTMRDDDVAVANQAFWKSCSVMMGAILQSAFKDGVAVEHARMPDIPISSGCFAYDINLPFKWQPSKEELICLSREAFLLAERKVTFERLEVSRAVAHQIFEDKMYKKHQIDHTNSDRIVLFRLGEFVDIGDGPMVTNTGFMQPYRFVFTCVHSFDDYLKPSNKLLRFQGVAAPSCFSVHHTSWRIIEDRASKPLLTDLAPSLQSSHEEVKPEDESTS